MAKVRISGSIWGTLFFDHANSLGDQEGFLIGETTRNVTTNISDSQINTSKEEICIDIQSFYPCDHTGSFYDNKGHVDVVQLLSLLKDKYKKVVGWYKFRRNTPSQISLRERAVHRSLANALHSVSMNTFVLGIFTSQQTWNQSTHMFGYQLSYLNNKKFVPLPVEVVNLGDTSQAEYKQTSREMPSMCSAYDSILEKYTSIFADSRGKSIGLQQMEEMSNTMQTELQKVSQKLLKSEIDVKQLQSEVDELRKKVAAKIPKRQIESSKEHQQETVQNTTNEQTDEKLTEKINRNVVNQMSPINPTSNFSLDELKCGNRKLSKEISMDEEIAEDLTVTAETEESSDPFAGLLSEMKNALKTSPGYMKGRQRLRTGSFEMNDDENASNDATRSRAFSDPPKNTTTQSKLSPRRNHGVLMEDDGGNVSMNDDSNVTSLSTSHEQSICQSASPTF